MRITLIQDVLRSEYIQQHIVTDVAVQYTCTQGHTQRGWKMHPARVPVPLSLQYVVVSFFQRDFPSDEAGYWTAVERLPFSHPRTTPSRHGFPTCVPQTPQHPADRHTKSNIYLETRFLDHLLASQVRYGKLQFIARLNRS